MTYYPTLYHELGYSVIPLHLARGGVCSCGPECGKTPGKHPALAEWGTYRTRRASPDEVDLWFLGRLGTDRNIGIVTGEISGNLAVLDFDNEGAWLEATSDYRNHWIKRAPRVATGRGTHVYLHLDGPVATTAFTLAGVRNHVKGEGGYVVAPPSLHPNGNTYEYVDRTNVRPLPATRQQVAAFLRIIGAEKEDPVANREQSASRFSTLLSERTPEGERHQRFAELAGYLRNVLPYDVCLEVMRLWMEARCDHPETMEDPANQVLSIYRYQPRRPTW